MSEQYGIKETKEAIVGVNELSLVLIDRLKDGYQSSDLTALVQKLLMDAQFKKVLEDAAKGINDVPKELKDLSLTEGVEIVKLQMEFVPKILAALKKE